MFVTETGVRFTWLSHQMITLYEKLEVCQPDDRKVYLVRWQKSDEPFVIYEEVPAAR